MQIRNEPQTVTHLTEIERVVKEPNVYIGSIEKSEYFVWLLNQETGFINFEEHFFSYGLIHLFEEVIANAMDNEKFDETQTMIDIYFDKESGQVTVINNGNGMSFSNVKGTNIPNPQMAFFVIGSSTHYIRKNKITAGKHGVGIKLVSILSNNFHVNIVHNGQMYTQSCKFKISDLTKPKITTKIPRKFQPYLKAPSTGLVSITYSPHFESFDTPDYTTNEEQQNILYNLILSRVITLGFLARSRIKFNGQLIGIKTMLDFTNLFLQCQTKTLVYESPEEVEYPWSLTLSLVSEECNPELQGKSVSFVNTVISRENGTHVEYIRNRTVSKYIYDKAVRKKLTQIKMDDINSLYFMVLNVTVPDPNYRGQIKTELATSIDKLRQIFTLPEIFVDKFIKNAGIMKILKEINSTKEHGVLHKQVRKKRTHLLSDSYTKAPKAGTKESQKCTLFIVEGFSASNTPRKGFSFINKQYYGLYTLRGKFLNVRNVSTSKLLKNVPFTELTQIIGLDTKMKYDTQEQLKTLNYGHICILTDQDLDGYHIRGLLLNVFGTFWPKLLTVPGFIQIFSTPLIKAYPLKSQEESSTTQEQTGRRKRGTRTVARRHEQRQQALIFFDESEFDRWQEEQGPNLSRKWIIRYFKGLGRIPDSEIEEVFTNLQFYIRNIVSSNVRDINSLQLAFAKTQADARKTWLSEYSPNDILDISQNVPITVYSFVHQQLKHFSHQSIIRAIPMITDGFKESQRKIFYITYNKHHSFQQEIKVENLANSVSTLTNYHHGAVSLSEAIIHMTTPVVGLNNIPYFYPDGQFDGGIFTGVEGSASPRYLATYLRDITKKIFRPEDNILLVHEVEEGMTIEPRYFFPIIPTILLNRVHGLATGWSTEIHPCNPIQLIDAIIGKLENRKTPKLEPWYQGFKGTLTKVPSKSEWISEGIYESTGPNKILIKIPPLGIYGIHIRRRTIEIYSKRGQTILAKQPTENADKTTCDIGLVLAKPMTHEEIVKTFGLRTKLSYSNIVAIVPEETETNGEINVTYTVRKFRNPEQIIDTWYPFRYKKYQERKAGIIKIMENEIKRISDIRRFIELVITKQIKVFKIQRDKVIEQLIRFKFPKIEDSYNYLLHIPVYKFTKEEIEKLDEDIKTLTKKYNDYKHKTVEQIWLEELGELRQAVENMN